MYYTIFFQRNYIPFTFIEPNDEKAKKVAEEYFETTKGGWLFCIKDDRPYPPTFRLIKQYPKEIR